jgi:Putative beta-barrel porin-2, OmpL-like. bbp2
MCRSAERRSLPPGNNPIIGTTRMVRSVIGELEEDDMRRICLTLALAIPATAATAIAQPAAPAPAPAPAPATPPAAPAPAAGAAPTTPAPAPAAAPAPAPAGDATKVAEAPAGDAAKADEAASTTTSAEAAAKPAVEVHGFASIAYSHNFTKTADHAIPLRTFDTTSETASIDVVELAVLRPVAKANDLGFRVDAVAGSAIPHVSAATGLFRDPGAPKGGDFDIQQAYASYKPGDALSIDVGKFVTPAGYELIEGYDGWNDHYSHSYLFGYAIPFTHTGARASYVSGDVTMTAYVVNGWNNATTANFGKTGGLNVLYVHGATTAALTYLGGKESDGWRHIIDALAVQKLGDQASVGVNVDYGIGGNTYGDDGMSAASWYGVAGYATYSPDPKFTLALRGEYFKDVDGWATTAKQDLEEGTLTAQFHINDDAHLRAEVRFDNSSVKPFGTMDDPSSTQVTAAINALAMF